MSGTGDPEPERLGDSAPSSVTPLSVSPGGPHCWRRMSWGQCHKDTEVDSFVRRRWVPADGKEEPAWSEPRSVSRKSIGAQRT